MPSSHNQPGANQSRQRRDVFDGTGAATAASPGILSSGTRGPRSYANTIRVGLIGCGGRGTGAAINSVNADPAVEIAALGDLFQDRLRAGRKNLQDRIGNRLTADEDRCFTGFNAYQKVIDTDVDYVILATPPGFRPIHIRAALEAGKHVFAEKPVAVDSAGVRSVLESAQLADRKNLAIVAGTQYRHHLGYQKVMQRVHRGDIGKIMGGQVYNLTGELWLRERQPGMSDMEWQIRNWYYFTWLSGDYITEQTIHDIDIGNWAMQGPPEKVLGTGGRQVRVSPEYGHIYDHFAAELHYPNGARILCLDRQQDGSARKYGQRVFGTRGTAELDVPEITGDNPWKLEQEVPNAYVQEHKDLINSFRAGEPLNEGERVAHSTLTAIMAREAGYTGQELTFDEVLQADMDLLPDTFAFGPAPTPSVATPGQTTLKRSWGE